MKSDLNLLQSMTSRRWQSRRCVRHITPSDIVSTSLT